MSTTPIVPAFTGDISFHAQHSPVGAFASFTCGNFGSRGGLAAQIGKPTNQDIYIGIKTGDRLSNAPLMCLPFFEGAVSNAAAFEVEQAQKKEVAGPTLRTYAKEQIKRHYGWGTDTWVTPDFSFTIHTPFESIPDPGMPGGAGPHSNTEEQLALLPAVIADLTVHNTSDQPKTACFAMNFVETGLRLIDQGLEEATGFALRDQLGFAGRLLVEDQGDEQVDGAVSDGQITPIMRWTPHEALVDEDNPLHLIGTCPGLAFTVPPGAKYTLRIALGFYLVGDVTTRLTGRYRYTRFFSSLTDVLDSALAMSDFLVIEAQHRDAELLESGLSPAQQFLIAHGTRSYHGSTQLLDVAGQPWWIVNEGEYCMMNTLDLSVDHVFWELRQNPWVIRNLLQNFVRYYAYHDQVKDPVTGQLFPGGISFSHDQGIHNQFSPFGHSSYELTNLPGCFSHMTVEQVCNWTLLASGFTATTGDRNWLRQNQHVIEACLTSMLNRDHPDPAKRDGVMKFDSSRCGPNGQEITTYDSLDHSLAQARNNLYVATKSWATYLGLALMFDSLDLPDQAKEARAGAERSAKLIASQLGPSGFIPAVFEKDNPGYGSKILPAIEALVHPQFWSEQSHSGESSTWIAENGPFAAMFKALRTHTLTLLKAGGRGEGFNIFPDGGLKLSSTSNNSWVSKNALVQHAARHVLKLESDPGIQKIFADADQAHVGWFVDPRNGFWAMSDQFVNGEAKGSKYYPRGVATAIWLE